jgi:hypothetical protein
MSNVTSMTISRAPSNKTLYEAQPIYQTANDGVLLIFVILGVFLYGTFIITVLVLRKSEADFKQKMDNLRMQHSSKTADVGHDKQVFDTSFTPEDEQLDIDDFCVDNGGEFSVEGTPQQRGGLSLPPSSHHHQKSPLAKPLSGRGPAVLTVDVNPLQGKSTPTDRKFGKVSKASKMSSR